jgi:lysophospholipase L1-like esterase
MIGDSITDANRDKPTGEGLFDAYGKGYVNLVNAQLGAVYPGEKIRVINMGLSGNTVRDLENRWAADVVGRRPDWLSVMIGINDVWRQFDTPLQAEWHVKIGEYEATLDKLCGSTRASLKGLVLMTPYFIEPNRTDPMRAMMDEYGAVVKKLAAKHDAVFVDTQTAFDEVLKKLHPVALAWDRIHPNTVGHAVIARAFLKAVGFEW